MSPKCVVNLHERVLLGCLKAATLDAAHVLIMARLGSRWSGRLGSRRTPKCLVRLPLPGPVERTFGTRYMNFKLFDSAFLLYIAGQLWFGAGGANLGSG